MITDIPLMTEQECTAVNDTLHALKEHWISRMPFVPFYSLGAATYFDFKRGYDEKAAAYNPLLREHFSDLYDRLTRTLETHLDASVAFHEPSAMPGFHIFGSSPVFTKPVAKIHRDLQYRLVDWGAKDADLDNPLTFTLAIALPESGGGVDMWDLWHEEVQGMPQQDIVSLAASRTRRHHAYRVGHLAVHSGHQVHQIAPSREMTPDDERITLQGHGIRCEDTWYLYW